MRPPAPTGGLARDTHRAECALSATPVCKGVKAETAAYTKLGRGDGTNFPCIPLLFCLARLEQNNDRVGLRYIIHRPQLMEPSQFLRFLQIRCSDFITVFCANTNPLNEVME